MRIFCISFEKLPSILGMKQFPSAFKHIHPSKFNSFQVIQLGPFDGEFDEAAITKNDSSGILAVNYL